MIQINKTIVNGQTIFITGAYGFIGQHLVRNLEMQGIKRIILYGHKNKKIEYGKSIMLEGDVRHKSNLERIFKKYRPAIIIHLASKSTVEEGQTNPYDAYDININGTLNILELSRKYKAQKIIVASTIHVYGRKSKLPLKETDTAAPSRSYETSKACADIISQSYADSYNLPVIIPRFVNVYGPGDLKFTRLIPFLIRSIIVNNQVELWSNSCSRDYLYIGDVISAYFMLINSSFLEDYQNKIVNFGTGISVPASVIARKLIAISHRKIPLQYINNKIRKDEISNLYVSYKKALILYGWSPQISLEQGLFSTFEWYKNYFSKHIK